MDSCLPASGWSCWFTVTFQKIPLQVICHIKQMGLTFSEQGPGRFASNSLLQYQLINYLTRTLYIRNLVSKQRRRMLVGGYDLDMSLLAMSFPAERMQAIFRNPLWQVKDVLDMRHNGHYKVKFRNHLRIPCHNCSSFVIKLHEYLMVFSVSLIFFLVVHPFSLYSTGL